MQSYSLTNQRLSCDASALHTSFSTVYVKSSCYGRAGGSTLWGKRGPGAYSSKRKSRGETLVPKNRAGEFFCLKSMPLRCRKTLPHNFVHRKCEEAHMRLLLAPGARFALVSRSASASGRTSVQAMKKERGAAPRSWLEPSATVFRKA